jgi:lipoprotein-releasing system permease protein
VFLAQGIDNGEDRTQLRLEHGFGGAWALETYKFIPLDPSIYFIDHLPVATQPLDVAWIVLASVLTAAIATLYPAIQASRLYPIDAIRHE